MNWRPWLVAGALFCALVINAGLLVTEEVKPAALDKASKFVGGDPLSKLKLTATNRRKNFEQFGLPEDLVDKADKAATRLSQERGKEWLALMSDPANSQLATAAFCEERGADSLPVRYQALSLLVAEEDNARKVIEPHDLTALAAQEWFGVKVNDVFEIVELEEGRQADATAMGIAAILVKQERIAVELILVILDGILFCRDGAFCFVVKRNVLTVFNQQIIESPA
jgi:hypothetical protein